MASHCRIMKYSENKKAKILIVDDHPIVREGIVQMINRQAEMHVCCEASNFTQALAANRSCTHDMAIVDMSLGEASGLDLISHLLSESPDFGILVMSMHDENFYAENALKAGARGYLMKHEATDTLLLAVRKILDGELFLSGKMHSRLLKRMMHGNKDASPIHGLTASEFEILHLIGIGLSSSAIAKKLSRSISTIESHRTNIKKKLNLDTGSQLVHYAISIVTKSS